MEWTILTTDDHHCSSLNLNSHPWMLWDWMLFMLKLKHKWIKPDQWVAIFWWPNFKIYDHIRCKCWQSIYSALEAAGSCRFLLRNVVVVSVGWPCYCLWANNNGGIVSGQWGVKLRWRVGWLGSEGLSWFAGWWRWRTTNMRKLSVTVN